MANGQIVDRPREDTRTASDMRRLGFVPVVNTTPALNLTCAECFESLFSTLEYDALNDQASQRLLTVAESKSRFAEWLLNVLSARQVAQSIRWQDNDWQVQFTLPVYHDLLTGVLTKTPTVVLATHAGQHDLLLLTEQQASELIAGYRRDYAKAAQTVMTIQTAVKEAETLEDLLEITATLDVSLPWVAFTRGN